MKILKKPKPNNRSLALFFSYISSDFSIAETIENPQTLGKPTIACDSKPEFNLSLVEKKLANALLLNANVQAKDMNGLYKIDIENLASVIGFDSKDNEFLKKSARSLMKIICEWSVLDNKKKEIFLDASALFPTFEISESVLSYELSSELMALVVDTEMKWPWQLLKSSSRLRISSAKC